MKLSRPKYDPETSTPISEWMSNEIALLGFAGARNDEQVTVKILDLLPPQMMTQVMSEFEDTKIKRIPLSNICATAIRRSQSDYY